MKAVTTLARVLFLMSASSFSFLSDTAIRRFETALALQQQGLLPDAIAHYQALLAEFPEQVLLWDALGVALHAFHQQAAAQAAFARALQLDPHRALTWNNCGVCHLECLQLPEAERCFRQALQANPLFFEAWANLAQSLRTQGKTQESLAALERAERLDPQPGLRFQRALTLPPLYQDIQELQHWRQRFHQELAALAADPPRIQDPWREIHIMPFYLAYQGQNDRPLMETLARVYLQACPSLRYEAPHLRYRPRRRRLRIAFASAHLHEHTIARIFSGMIQAWDAQRFERILIGFSSPLSPQRWARQVGVEGAVNLPPDFFQARELLSALELDLLFWLDLGMEPRSWFLAFARLAHLQLVTWGHPVTTGLSEIDWFVSNQGLEPQGAQGHYREPLMLLSGLHPVYPLPVAPAPDRSRFGFDPTQHLYFCPQSLFKLHPDLDPLLAGILRQDPQGVLLLPAAPVPAWQELLLQRWRRTLPEFLPRICFLPRLQQTEFLQLLASVDVILDPPHFGGGNTSYEALGLAMPVVTWPGETLRGRFTQGFYRQLGVSDLVAQNAQDYVALALRLVQDPAWRHRLQEQLRAARPLLFDCPAGVRELETALLQYF